MITKNIVGVWYNLHDLFEVSKSTHWILNNPSANAMFVIESTTAPDLALSVMNNRNGIVLESGQTCLISPTTTNVWLYGHGIATLNSVINKSGSPFSIMDLPQDVWTSDQEKFRRLRVDVGQTGFFEGREFRMVRKIVVPAATPRVFRFTSTVDFILFEQHLAVTTGDLEYYAWRSTQGTPSGTFTNIPVPPIGKNISANFRDYGAGRYTSNVTIASGGDFIPTDVEVYVDYDRAKTSSATAQRQSVSGGDDSVRYLAAGTYYLKITSLDGTSEGRFAIAWEERPN